MFDLIFTVYTSIDGLLGFNSVVQQDIHCRQQWRRRDRERVQTPEKLSTELWNCYWILHNISQSSLLILDNGGKREVNRNFKLEFRSSSNAMLRCRVDFLPRIEMKYLQSKWKFQHFLSTDNPNCHWYFFLAKAKATSWAATNTRCCRAQQSHIIDEIFHLIILNFLNCRTCTISLLPATN